MRTFHITYTPSLVRTSCNSSDFYVVCHRLTYHYSPKQLEFPTRAHNKSWYYNRAQTAANIIHRMIHTLLPFSYISASIPADSQKCTSWSSLWFQLLSLDPRTFHGCYTAGCCTWLLRITGTYELPIIPRIICTTPLFFSLTIGYLMYAS